VLGIVELEVSCAWARTLAKLLEDDDDPAPVDEVPVTPVVDVLATEGSNAVCIEAICAWICETRLTASV
jgi:hypothetical protein